MGAIVMRDRTLLLLTAIVLCGLIIAAGRYFGASTVADVMTAAVIVGLAIEVIRLRRNQK